MSPNTVAAFWAQYLATLPSDHPHHTAAYFPFMFGDSPALADELAGLVLAGIKTATAGLLWEYEFDNDPLPHVGMLSIMQDGTEQPLAVLETTAVQVLPFSEVDDQQAYAEGEGDRSLAFWRAAHWKFFGRSCARIGREPSESMPVVCEHFRLLYVSA